MDEATQDGSEENGAYEPGNCPRCLAAVPVWVPFDQDRQQLIEQGLEAHMDSDECVVPDDNQVGLDENGEPV